MVKREAAILFIFITVFVDVIGFGIIIPIMPSLIGKLIDGNLSEASMYSGWLMFAFSIMQFVFSPILGNLSDRYGRRPVLLLSLMGFGIDYILLAFAPNIVWLFIGRVIAGIMGASYTTATAYIADISTPEKRAQNFGMIGAAFGLGFIIGPVIGGLLGKFGTEVPFLFASALTLLNCVYGFFVLPESLLPENRRPFDWKRANPVGSLVQLKRYPLILGLIGSFLCFNIAGHAAQSTWTFFTMEQFKWDEAWVGYSLGVVGLLIAIVQGGLIGKVNAWIGMKRSIYWGLAIYALGCVLIALSTETWMVFAALIPFCFGCIAGPTIQSLMSGQVPANEQGELQGALTSLMSVTAIIGPLLMTYLFSLFTEAGAIVYFPGAPFIAAMLLTLLAVFLAYGTLKKIKA
jgi:MFS transporter, DHA1 family, tetracycline resistance protein